MKFGVRTPSISRSIKARTTGRVKRAVKKSVNPLYGKKGMTMVKDPSKAVYNAVYRRTSVSAVDLLKSKKSGNTETSKKRQAVNKSQISTNERQVLYEEMQKATEELNVLIPVVNSIEGGDFDLDLYIDAYDESIEIMKFLFKCKSIFNIDSNEGFERNVENLTVNKILHMNGAIEKAEQKCSAEIDGLKQNAVKLKRTDKFKESVINHINVLSPSNMVFFYNSYNRLLDKIDVDESKKEKLDLDDLIAQSNQELEPNFSLDDDYSIEYVDVSSKYTSTTNTNKKTPTNTKSKGCLIIFIIIIVLILGMCSQKDDNQSVYVDDSEIDIEESYDDSSAVSESYDLKSLTTTNIDDFVKYYEEGDRVKIKGVYEFGWMDTIHLIAKDKNGGEHEIECRGFGLSYEERTEYEDNYSRARRNAGEGRKAVFTVSGIVSSVEAYNEDNFQYQNNVIEECKIEKIKEK